MVLDVSMFGIGIGLVMVGWVAGLVVSMVFSIVRGVSLL